MKRSAPFVVAAILLLGACTDPTSGGGVSDAESPTVVAAEPEAQEPEETESETTPITDDPASTAPGQEPAAGGGPECIVGVWDLDLGTFEAALQSMIVNSPGTTTLEGELAVQFTPTGEYTQFKDEFTILTTVAGQTVRSVTTGALTGSYLVEGDIVHLFDGFDIYHESYMEMPGIGRVDIATGEDAEFDVFGYQYTAPSDADFGTYNGAGKFTCTSTGLTIEIEGKSVDWVPGSVPDMTGWK